MDEFLKDTYVVIFKKWIILQSDKRYQLSIKDNTINLETKDLIGQIIFNHQAIIEMIIYNKQLQENDFYLHFEMKNLKHAINLYYEMTDTINKYINKPKVKILLCCSGGLTTSYFAEKLNEAFNLLNISMEVNATGYHRIYQIIQDYDLVLLAPQVSFYHSEIKKVLKNKPVVKIPPAIFGKYDVTKMIKIIQDTLNTKNFLNNDNNNKPTIKKRYHHGVDTLSISIYKNYQKNYISYNVYDKKQNIISHHDIVKTTLNIEDIYDVLNTVFIQYPDIDHIGISLPTIVHNGYLEEDIIDGLVDNNLIEALTSHYNKKFYLSNDTNNAVLGYYATQDKYKTIAFVFQPIKYPGGSGMIIDGKLHEGFKHLAGEIKYIPMNLSKDYIELTMTPFGTLELLSKVVVSLISIINPEIVIIKSDLLLDVNDLHQEINKYIPKEYIPPIVKINDLQEYILLGNLVLCHQQMEKD